MSQIDPPDSVCGPAAVAEVPQMEHSMQSTVAAAARARGGRRRLGGLQVLGRRRRRLAVPLWPGRRRARGLLEDNDERELDLPPLEVHPHHLHLDAIAE